MSEWAKAARIGRKYGGTRQELRAALATSLIGWAQRIHFAATMDMARGLATLEAEAQAAARPMHRCAVDGATCLWGPCPPAHCRRRVAETAP